MPGADRADELVALYLPVICVSVFALIEGKNRNIKEENYHSAEGRIFALGGAQRRAKIK
jgi:hypothetical protein